MCQLFDKINKLPDTIKKNIYEFDSTYRCIFSSVLQEILLRALPVKHRIIQRYLFDEYNQNNTTFSINEIDEQFTILFSNHKCIKLYVFTHNEAYNKCYYEEEDLVCSGGWISNIDLFLDSSYLNYLDKYVNKQVLEKGFEYYLGEYIEYYDKYTKEIYYVYQK